MLAKLKVWWPWAVMTAVVIVLSLAFWWADRVWLAHNDELEGCRHWCHAHRDYNTPDKYVGCVRKCKEAIDAPKTD